MKDLDFAVLPWIGLLLALASLTGVQLLMKTGGFIRLLPKWMRFATVFLRWLLVVVVLSILLIAIGPLRHLESIPFQNRTAAQSAAGAADPGKLTDEAIKSNIDELKWMLTILAGFAVITALAQAAAAWMSALTYDKQASAKLQEIEKTLDNFNARYPVFTMVEEKRNQAHDAVIVSLRKVFGTADEQGDPTEAISWMKDFYHELSVEKRQLLLSVESFASIDVHPPHKGSRVQNLKLFAVVYHAKYRYERGMGAFALFNDLERAESYLLLALRESPADFTLYNELGNIYLTMWETAGKLSSDYPDYLQKAQKAFEDSMDFEGNQQRAPYNLAFIEYQRKDYASACKLLEEALRISKLWQKLPTPGFLGSYVHYNLACNRARLLVLAHKGMSRIGLEEAKSVTSALKTASEIGSIREEYLRTDYSDQNAGDIYGLFVRADAALRDELERLKQALVTKHVPEPEKNFWAIVSQASAMIWDSMKESFSKD